jgi:hypothetical protein
VLSGKQPGSFRALARGLFKLCRDLFGLRRYRGILPARLIRGPVVVLTMRFFSFVCCCRRDCRSHGWFFRVGHPHAASSFSSSSWVAFVLAALIGGMDSLCPSWAPMPSALSPEDSSSMIEAPAVSYSGCGCKVSCAGRPQSSSSSWVIHGRVAQESIPFDVKGLQPPPASYRRAVRL